MFQVIVKLSNVARETELIHVTNFWLMITKSTSYYG